jgi:hypothetical protein
LFMDAKAGLGHHEMMKMLLAIMLLFAPAAGFANTITLTPEQAEAAKEAGATRNARAAELGLEPGQDKAIHGEMGVAVGTGGYRSIYGTAVVPLGDNAMLGLSFANEQYGNGRYRRRY